MRMFFCALFFVVGLFMGRSEIIAGNILSNENQLQNKIKLYQEFLKNLDSTDFNSIDLARVEYVEVFKLSSQAEKDSAFNVFWEYFMVFANTQSYLLEEKYKKLYGDAIYDIVYISDYPSEKSETKLKKTGNKYSEELLQLLSKFNKYGLMVATSEGFLYCSIASNKLIENYFKDFISKNANDYYFKIVEQESNPTFSDAAIRIEMKEMVNRGIWWEEFSKRDNLSYTYKSSAEQFYKAFLETLLNGVDNSPAFDYQSNKLTKEYKLAFEYAIKKYPSTETGKILIDYMKVLKKNKMKNTKEVQEFIAKTMKY